MCMIIWSASRQKGCLCFHANWGRKVALLPAACCYAWWNHPGCLPSHSAHAWPTGTPCQYWCQSWHNSLQDVHGGKTKGSDRSSLSITQNQATVHYSWAGSNWFLPVSDRISVWEEAAGLLCGGWGSLCVPVGAWFSARLSEAWLATAKNAQCSLCCPDSHCHTTGKFTEIVGAWNWII